MRTLFSASPIVSLLALSLMALLAGCPEKEDYRKQGPAAESPGASAQPSEPPPPPKKKKAAPPADLGTCSITVAGGLAAEQVSAGGKDATNVAYWYTAEERKNMMGVDGYVVTCKGDKFRFQLLPGGGKLDGMPFAPKKFTFKKGKSEDANVMMAITGSNATLADATGTVEVTQLDAKHIAGTIDLAGKIVPGNKAVTVKGEFNLVCPGLSACDFGDAP